jgi:hypothetical protein
MNMPQFTADASLYRTNRRYRLTAFLGTNLGGQVSPAVQKGFSCVVSDPNCPSGFSGLFCRDFNPDNCVETGRCCTKPVTCGPCVGTRQCSDGSRRTCSV